MDKRVGRIPAGQADSAKEWVLPEVAPDDADNNRVFKLRGNTAPGRFKEDKSDARVLRSWSEGRRATKKPQQPSKHAAVEHVPTADSPAEAPAQSASQGIDEHGPSVIATDDAYAKGFKKGEVEGFTQGEARGFEVGQQAGHEQVRREVEQAFEEEIEAKRKIIAELQAAFIEPPDHSQIITGSLVPLISEVTQLVVLNEVKTSSEHIEKLLQSALSALPEGADKIEVKVNPDDLEWLQNFIAGIDITLIADESLSVGSCIVVSEQSKVDASLSGRIHRCLVQTFADEQIKELSEADLLQTSREMDQK